MKDETRSFFADELRVVDGAEGQLPKIVGYAAVFNSLSEDLGGFREMILPGAFAGALAPDREVLALVAHDTSQILGRRSAGTLNLREDNKGLYVEISPPNNTLGKDTVESVRRKDFTGMSFRFAPDVKDDWSRESSGFRKRTIRSFGTLREVTVTGIPAYPESTAELREKLAAMDREETGTPRLNLARRRLRLLRAEIGESRDMQYDPIASALRCNLGTFRNAFDVAQATTDLMDGINKGDLSPAALQACIDLCDAASDAMDRMETMIEELAGYLPADKQTT